MREAAQLNKEYAGAEPVDGRLAELYARHVPAGMRLAFLLTGNRQQAEDLVQEAFVKCVGRFRHLRVPDAFDAYLRRAIVNLHTSGLRRKRLERRWLAGAGRTAAKKTASMPDVGAREDLWRTLLELPPRQRAALVLRYYEDQSEHDTAQAPYAVADGVTVIAPRDRDGHGPGVTWALAASLDKHQYCVEFDAGDVGSGVYGAPTVGGPPAGPSADAPAQAMVAPDAAGEFVIESVPSNVDRIEVDGHLGGTFAGICVDPH